MSERERGGKGKICYRFVFFLFFLLLIERFITVQWALLCRSAASFVFENIFFCFFFRLLFCSTENIFSFRWCFLFVRFMVQLLVSTRFNSFDHNKLRVNESLRWVVGVASAKNPNEVPILHNTWSYMRFWHVLQVLRGHNKTQSYRELLNLVAYVF